MRQLIVTVTLFLFASTPATAAPVDLKDTPEAQKAAEWVREHIAQGNERSAKIEKLTIDPKTGDVEVELSIRNRQVSGRVFGKPIVAYDWTVKGSGTFNARTGRVGGKIDLGRGVKVDVKDLAGKLGSIVK